MIRSQEKKTAFHSKEKQPFFSPVPTIQPKLKIGSPNELTHVAQQEKSLGPSVLQRQQAHRSSAESHDDSSLSQPGNPGILLGIETRNGVSYARYRAVKGTWVSASLLQHGYAHRYGPEVGYGAYHGIVLDGQHTPLSNPDLIHPGQVYLFPVPTPTQHYEFEQKEIIPNYRYQLTETAGEWEQEWWKRGGKDFARIFHPIYDSGAYPTYPSFELTGAPKPPPLSSRREQVAFWLTYHKNLIERSADRWEVSKIAIAGVIAWEALENPQSASLQSVGPGKMHLEEEGWAGKVGEELYGSAVEGVQNLELFGNEPRTAINYIGAAMNIMALAAEEHDYNIRNLPEMLAWVYHSQSPDSWEEILQTRDWSQPFRFPKGTMGPWVKENREYLETAVGEDSSFYIRRR